MDVAADAAEVLDAVVSRAAVVLSAAGPFSLVGGPLVAACVRCGTHYCDTTGACGARADPSALVRLYVFLPKPDKSDNPSLDVWMG